MIRFPIAKINIGLNVKEKRPDGFHNIESVFYPLPLRDVLEAVPAKRFNFNTQGLQIPGDKEDNLCVKAYRLLKETHSIPQVNLFLYKKIPPGSGLGGASSNGTSTLLLMDQLFDLQLPDSVLHDLASRLGSDCPFFIHNEPGYVTGRGEKLRKTSLDLSGYHIVVLVPKQRISTAQAYQNISPSLHSTDLLEILSQPVKKWDGKVKNDFEPFVFRHYPEIKKLKQELREEGALYASLSGSGSALYAIFDHPPLLNDKLRENVVWEGKPEEP